MFYVCLFYKYLLTFLVKRRFETKYYEIKVSFKSIINIIHYIANYYLLCAYLSARDLVVFHRSAIYVL